ncbi:MAG: EAL domain-containing protein [Sideroxydans sp.]|nr:EAL domain-containing protein [Sideroxydans sp.]
MPSILPAEHYRSFPRAPRAQLLANIVLAQEKGDAMTALEHIIARRKLSALFQPIIDLNSGEFLGCEGLIRGPADSTLHLPAHLFGAAEQEDLSLEVEMLSRQIVLEAFAKQKLPGKLFLNVSPETLTHPSFKNGQTLAFLNKLGIDPQRVIIEITENQATFDFEAMRGALLLVEKNMPIEEFSHFLSEADSRHFADGFIISENGRYIGVASGQDLLRELTQMQLQAARYASSGKPPD